MRKIIISGLVTGIISGMLLFLVCFYVEFAAEMELMTLLLNVDFIYDGGLNIVLEVALHLVVSVILATVLKWLYVYRKELYMPGMVTVGAVTTLLYFILSTLAVQNLELYGYIGFTLWVILHIGYLESLHLMYRLGM
ncbi:hypothetical protein ACFOLA_04585 [Salinicoccus hispanicus]|uniref:DUF3021 family protein n=1 Tax=Salinicoccus hispanicus TaxID=157225 RepID=A0A6N8U2W4_9STAP|nr:hypothetical protein [Salinicoccus hispanicus]MXQ52093.1 hypothetical protein [Salinicoccus hispanicus]